MEISIGAIKLILNNMFSIVLPLNNLITHIPKTLTNNSIRETFRNPLPRFHFETAALDATHSFARFCCV